MSEARGGGNGLMGRLNNGVAGGPLGSNGMQPSQSSGADDNQIDVPYLGRIDRGASPIHTEHNGIKAFYNKMREGVRRLDHVRVELDKLVDMGDTVSPEDVVAAAGRVVAHGVPASEIATLLAAMPTQAGQGLAAWLMQQDAGLTQQEAHFAHFSQIAAYHMGLSAQRVIAAEHLAGEARQQTAGMASWRRAAAKLRSSLQRVVTNAGASRSRPSSK